jgi:hypothetical protein
VTYEQAMMQTSRELNIRGSIRVVGGTIINLTNEHIMSYRVDEGANEIPLGSAASASYSLELDNTSGQWFRGGSMIGNRVLMGARVTVEIGVFHDGAFEYKPAGVWFVNKAIGKEGATRFTLRGGDALLTGYNAKFNDNITYGASTTITTIINRLIAVGADVQGSLACNANAVISAKPDWGEGCSIRNVLAFVAAAGGCFVQIDRSGVLRFVPVKKTAVKAIATDSYLELENSNEYFSFNRIKVMPRGAKSEDPYIEGAVNTATIEAGNNTLVMEDNPLFAAGATNLQAMTNALATALGGFEVDVLSFRHRGDPTMTLGDRVQVTDRRGGVVNTPILQQTMKYFNGFSCAVSSILPLEVMTAGAISRNGTILPIGFGQGSLDPNILVAKSITADQIAAGSITADEIAAKTITADEIAAETITADEIAADAITTKHLSAGSITANKAIIADAAINAAQIQDAAIETAKIKDAAITNAKIANAAIETAKINDLAVTNAKIADATIETAKIKDAAIDTAKIKDASITNAKIANATIERGKIANAAIGSAQIDNLAVTTAKIALGAITTALINTGAVGTVQIADGSITDAKIVELTANKINAGTLSVERLVIVGTNKSIVYTINEANGTAQLSKTTIDGGALTQRSITADRIVAAAITANEIASKTILANNIASNTITAGEIASDAIEARHIKAGIIETSHITSGARESLRLEAINTLELGTVNLLKNSDWSRGLNTEWAWVGDGALLLDTNSLQDGKPSVRVTLNTPETSGYYRQSINDLTTGTARDFTFSFYIRIATTHLLKYGTSSVAEMVCYGGETALATYRIYPDEVTPNNLEFTRVAKTFSAPAGTTQIRVYIRARGDGLSTSVLYFANAQVEAGNKASAWGLSLADPVGTLESSGISIGADHLDLYSSGVLSANGSTIVLKTNDFSISADNEDETEVVSVTPDGVNIGAEFLHANRIRGDVVNTHSGVTVTADAGIQTALDSLGKYLNSATTVSIGAGTYNEHVVISGFFGDTLTLNFADNVKINGSIKVFGNGYVFLNGGSTVKTIINHTGANYTDGVYARSNAKLQATNLRIIGKARTSVADGTRAGIHIESGAAQITNCMVQKVRYGVLFEYGGTGLVSNCSGGITGSSATDYSTMCILTAAIASLSGSHIGVSGTMPTAPTILSTSNGTIVGTAPSGTQDTTAAPIVETSTVFTSTGTRRLRAKQTRTGLKSTGSPSITWGSWGSAVNESWGTGLPRQGSLILAYTVTGGGSLGTYYSQVKDLYYSVWLFGTLTNISNATQVKMTITRSADLGPTGNEDFTLYRHNYTSAPTGSDYSALTTTGITVTLARGETKTIAITGTTLTNLKNGVIKGFGLHSAGGDFAQCAGTMKLEVYY